VIGRPFDVVSGSVGMNLEVTPWLEQRWRTAAATALLFGLPAGACMFLGSYERP